ncbi:hypothetical protein Tco_0187610, partial [Tanacetum coccineum]
MSGNIAHLLDFKDFDGGYVTFGGGANGGRITGKVLDKCRIHISVCTDISEITRKQSKNEQARTRERKSEQKPEAKPGKSSL